LYDSSLLLGHGKQNFLRTPVHWACRGHTLKPMKPAVHTKYNSQYTSFTLWKLEC